MKTLQKCNQKLKASLLLSLILMFGLQLSQANNNFEESTNNAILNFDEYRGQITDSQTGDALAFATISIEGTNIATVTNSEGYFSLKVPSDSHHKSVNVSYIGYQQKEIALNNLNTRKNNISLDVLDVSLDEISIFPTDPRELITNVLAKKNDNYTQDESLMTAFYRETIQKRNTYASLSEAVVEIHKRAYRSSQDDVVRLLKSRKSADYKKLDTVLFKLQGGPYNTLMLDIMKDPYMIISHDMMDLYDFSISSFTKKDDKILYIVSFNQKDWVEDPLFYGKLYIESESLAIVSASYNINTEDKEKVASMFIKKKPLFADVYPTKATYLVKYEEKDGKWLYNYSRGEISFKIKWNKKLFNTTYNTCAEMAVTDWNKTEAKAFKGSDKMKMNVVMRDTENGFSDSEFWGEYNVIEPEKSIESAIKKIKKNLNELDN